SPSPYLNDLVWLLPVALLLIHAVWDHFRNFNRKSPISKFKYTFLLVFSLAQLITIVLYMGENYEYLLLLTFPVSIILSRMLKFLPKPWMQESAFWLLIFSLLVFKLADFFTLNI